jgi:hypothetical protein
MAPQDETRDRERSIADDELIDQESAEDEDDEFDDAEDDSEEDSDEDVIE